MTDLELRTSRPLSAAYSTIDGDALGGFIASAYPFDAPFTCRLLRRGFNDVYLLRFADGHKKVARLSSRRARGASNVAYETALLRHLKQAGGDVAAPLGTNTGALSIEVAAVEGQRSLVVFEYLEGQFPGVDLQDTKAMAASLATLHRLAGDYGGPPSQYVLDLGHLVMRPLQRLLDHESTDKALAERLRKIAADLIAKIEAAPQLTRVVCHGDCHGGNTFMTSAPDGRRVGSFFDFDDGGPGYLAYDLAVYLWAMLLHREEAALSEEQHARWTCFVEGYRAVSPVSPNDYAAIARFVCARHFWFLGEYASRSDEWGSAALPLEWLRKQAGKLESWSGMETP
ncbi:phosphotransferase [Caballeronia sp. LZ034LL]|uniref:phosphotransferase enzyme family protein n=1 Tax=Caballeronia sp. LZ034LL TaxID=3038567 RepID=UPI0028603D41|nr:phosphotransferase [Caballeronia sp. LZ034LL]MDR5837013.1 phosphotransferase [Caballeronia sp. LZ034LL]